MTLKHLLPVLLCMAFAPVRAGLPVTPHQVVVELTVEDLCEAGDRSSKPHPILQFLKKKQRDNRKVTAALLAFPFPLGIVAMHRIYLGTAPFVPVVYIATAGGVFGLLPLIDFVMILVEKDTTRFTGNRQVFMWVD